MEPYFLPFPWKFFSLGGEEKNSTKNKEGFNHKNNYKMKSISPHHLTSHINKLFLLPFLSCYQMEPN